MIKKKTDEDKWVQKEKNLYKNVRKKTSDDKMNTDEDKRYKGRNFYKKRVQMKKKEEEWVQDGYKTYKTKWILQSVLKITIFLLKKLPL